MPEREGPPVPTSDIPYRLTVVEAKATRHDDRLDAVENTTVKLDLEVHGERGINATLRELSNEIKWLRRALWGLAASVTTAAIVFALSTLSHP